MIYRKSLVYYYPFHHMENLFILDKPSIECSYIKATNENLSNYFHSDSKKISLFKKFLGNGCQGIYLVNNREWIAYGWITKPNIGKPPHLPNWIKIFGFCWIFYCHTKEEYRGKGFYKMLLQLLITMALENYPQNRIMIDTSIENIASRKAIRSVGFLPNGIIDCINIPISKMNRAIIGKWDKYKTHPAL
jgi:RimJ/RimL family protein N-acetyltransferase